MSDDQKKSTPTPVPSQTPPPSQPPERPKPPTSRTDIREGDGGSPTAVRPKPDQKKIQD